MFFRLFFVWVPIFDPTPVQYFIQIPHIIFCCPLSAYDKWWFEQKKSQHFREKYLVLSYLNSVLSRSTFHLRDHISVDLHDWRILCFCHKFTSSNGSLLLSLCITRSYKACHDSDDGMLDTWGDRKSRVLPRTHMGVRPCTRTRMRVCVLCVFCLCVCVK